MMMKLWKKVLWFKAKNKGWDVVYSRCFVMICLFFQISIEDTEKVQLLASPFSHTLVCTWNVNITREAHELRMPSH